MSAWRQKTNQTSNIVLGMGWDGKVENAPLLRHHNYERRSEGNAQPKSGRSSGNKGKSGVDRCHNSVANMPSCDANGRSCYFLVFSVPKHRTSLLHYMPTLYSMQHLRANVTMRLLPSYLSCQVYSTHDHAASFGRSLDLDTAQSHHVYNHSSSEHYSGLLSPPSRLPAKPKRTC
jgi:hypothetical protein